MQAYLSPSPKLRFYGRDGKPLAGGHLITYDGETSQPVATFADESQTAYNPYQLDLDSNGEPSCQGNPRNVYLEPGKSYIFRWFDCNGEDIDSASVRVQGAGAPVPINIRFNSPNDTIEIRERTVGTTTVVDLDVKGGGTSYSSGEGIEIVNGKINVKYGNGIELEDNNLQVSGTIRRTLSSVQNKINTHEVSLEAHPDIREAIDEMAIDVDDSLSVESTNPVENRVVTEAVNSKQDQLTEMTDNEIDDLINSLN